MPTKVTSSLINTINASQITAAGATAGQVLTYNGSTSTWVASAAPGGASGRVAAWAYWTEAATTGAITINSSYNISSISKVNDASSTKRTITFTNAVASYAVIATCKALVGDGYGGIYTAQAAPIDSSSCVLYHYAINSIGTVQYSIAVFN